MPSFPHLNLSLKITGIPNPKKSGGGGQPDQQTLQNMADRPAHSDDLEQKYSKQDKFWKDFISKRREEGKPELPNPDVIPVLLTVDSKTFDIESLKGLGIEIIAEEENGQIIGASSDKFVSLAKKIDKFRQEVTRSGGIAKLWDIEEGVKWKLDRIVSESLLARWENVENELLIVDISISCYTKLSDRPKQKKEQTVEKYEQSLDKWESKRKLAESSRDDIEFERQDSFEKLVKAYGGERLTSFVSLSDSFGCRIRLNGAALKDLIYSYQYLFDVVEADTNDEISSNNIGEDLNTDELELLPPNIDAPKVCVIDSGIQEGHKLLSVAIQADASYCFLPNQPSNVADEVTGGGHGTRVAGSILYPHSIPQSGQYQLPFWIQNARILDERCQLPLELYPPALMREVVGRYPNTQIFNLSVNSGTACRLVHMSAWAAQLDYLAHKHNKLFIVSTGNIYTDNGGKKFLPGIVNFYDRHIPYPDYLYKSVSRISNPSQSAFALTVGSVCLDKYEETDRESFGNHDEASAFTKTGPSLWGMIKPDVVEYGGDLVRQKIGDLNLTEQQTTSPELVRSTLGGGLATGRDSVGTSYAAPRVAHIAAMVQRILPNEKAYLYRALVVQSARLPFGWLKNPTYRHLQTHGFGIPNAERATGNSKQRITFISSGEIQPQKAHLYSVVIPQELRSPGDSYDVLVEITLSFYAEPRRTRRTTRSYLSARAAWESSKIGEPFKVFEDRILNLISQDDDEETQEDLDTKSILWKVGNRTNSGVRGISRNNNTLQKDWTILKSNQLPEELGIGVIGRKGWQKDTEQAVPYGLVVSFEFIEADVEVYEKIRIANEISIESRIEIQS